MLKFFTGDYALCGGECIFEKIVKVIEKGDREKLKLLTRPEACTAKTLVLRWRYEPEGELLIEPLGFEEMKEHIQGTEVDDALSEIKRLGVHYVMNAPIVLAYLEEEAEREHPELQVRPKRFGWAKAPSNTGKFLSEITCEMSVRLAELNNRLVLLIRQWLLDPLRMPKTKCRICAPFGGLGYG